MSLVIFYIAFVCSLFTFVGILSWILFHLLSYLMPRTDCVITSYFVFCILWGVPVIFVFYATWLWKHLEKKSNLFFLSSLRSLTFKEFLFLPLWLLI